MRSSRSRMRTDGWQFFRLQLRDGLPGLKQGKAQELANIIATMADYCCVKVHYWIIRKRSIELVGYFDRTVDIGDEDLVRLAHLTKGDAGGAALSVSLAAAGPRTGPGRLVRLAERRRIGDLSTFGKLLSSAMRNCIRQGTGKRGSMWRDRFYSHCLADAEHGLLVAACLDVGRVRRRHPSGLADASRVLTSVEQDGVGTLKTLCGFSRVCAGIERHWKKVRQAAAKKWLDVVLEDCVDQERNQSTSKKQVSFNELLDNTLAAWCRRNPRGRIEDFYAQYPSLKSVVRSVFHEQRARSGPLAGRDWFRQLGGPGPKPRP